MKYNINPDTFVEIADSIRKEPLNSLFEGDEEENSVATVVLDSLLKVGKIWEKLKINVYSVIQILDWN